jgi:DNA-binding SARP family transcriptional activator
VCFSIAVLVLVGHPAWAATLQVLRNGSVEVAVVAPIDGTVPVSGELRGPSAQAAVTEVAWPYEADGYVANTGDRLVTFAVEMTGSAKLALLIDGSPQPLDLSDFSGGSGTESYVASVPSDTHSVDVALTDAGFTQTFSLWSLVRTSRAPAVLYDDPTSSSVIEQLGITKTVPIQDPTLGATTASVFISSGMLSAFNPDGTNVVAPPGHKYLVVAMTADSTSAEWNSFNYLLNITQLPGGAVTFTSSAGRKYVAQRSKLTGDDLSTPDDGMLDATYAFLVPDSTTHGVVSIGPATTSGQTYNSYLNSGPLETVEVGGPMRFSIGFPKPPAVERQPAPPWFSEPVPPTGLPGASSSAPGGLPIWLALVVLALVIGVILVRRLRLRVDASRAPVEPVPEPRPEDAPSTAVPVIESPGEMSLFVGVMGAVRVTPVNEPLTEFGRAFLSYLGVHDDRPRTVDDAQTALWPTSSTEADITRKTFLNHVTTVRRAVGTRHLPDNVQRNGYRLEHATTDWHRFRALATQAGRATGTQAHQLRVTALEFVRGVPFESELSRWFQWTDSEGLRTAITKAVVAVAVDAHAECVQTGDLDGAEWALRQGLLANPFELTLWACLADVVQARDDRSDLERFWRDASACLDEGAVEMLRDRVLG